MKEIQLTRGKVTIVNENDYKILSLHKWYYCSGYAVREVKGKSIRMHRIILEAKDGEIVDHINGETLDNRRLNLRLTDNGGNAYNCKKRKNCTSDYKGVHKHSKLKRRIMYRATIQYKGKKMHIGSYVTEIEAAIAYNRKAKELFGEFAKLNVIGENNEIK